MVATPPMRSEPLLPERSAAAALPCGYAVHEYRIERTLGGGGFGLTYLAQDANLQLPVALKEYFPVELATRGPGALVHAGTPDPEVQASFDWGLERFLEEARALAAFRHPNIVRVLRYFRANGTAYIVMEYEDGLPLKRWVAEQGPLTRDAVLALVAPLLDGLEAVHALGFLHRDIKPDNICVRSDGAPVLLDFGSARRPSGGRERTHIVSPGFAPFEQYHGHGHQGPWTDLYSLGAVLYWMTTGRKPLDAATRVRQDDLLPARALADVQVHGEALLEAIDWALQPDPSKRPQAVTAFRAALFGDCAKASPVLASDAAAAASAPAAPREAAGAAAANGARRTVVCTLLSVDMGGQSARPIDEQAALRRLLDEFLGRALKGIAEDNRVSVDAGDGAVVCFLGDPEEALDSALLLRDLLAQRLGARLPVRIGLHMGPVRILALPQGRTHVVGDGFNVAQRVMDFARAGQVLVSRACHEVVSRITDGSQLAFGHLGAYLDSDGRRHEVFQVEPAANGRTRPQGPSTGYTRTSPLASDQPLDDAAVAQVEAELARHIGPLAKVLVRKARPLAHGIARLREVLAPSIPDPRVREAFLHAAGGLSQPISAPRFRPSAPGELFMEPALRGSTSQPARASNLPTEALAVVEAALTRSVGPMARVLVHREAAGHDTVRDLAHALAAALGQPQRETFLRQVRPVLREDKSG